MMTPELGVCYYPEHWDEAVWKVDAQRMAECGLTWVRIGEFAWSQLEPEPDRMEFDWLDRALDILGSAGLKVILGTPTATPPRWMLDKWPDMLPVGEDGRMRRFGSRRHYCFSHRGYLSECRRIAELLGRRYGQHPYVHAWQIDNEYGCHDTALSYSDSALEGFRIWLQQRYQSISALNRAWGNAFWSMDYDSFDQIELPNLTVTEPNPAHTVDFRRFSSDQVVAFNKVQVDALRPLTDRPLLHNYMGRQLGFDHFRTGRDLDIAGWDSYPIGFLSDRLDASESDKLRFLRQGDPDCQAFHHDLYRAVGDGRWWVMEQQPGPVNWAPWNPAPLPGMVRLWTWEALAHGAEAVCYFRWRQAPFGQEQNHAGLLRPDGAPAEALAEAKKVAEELSELDPLQPIQAPVALIFDYESAWVIDTQPQGADFSYFGLVFDAYRALRRAGLSVDILSPDAALDSYRLVLAPGLAVFGQNLKARLAEHSGTVILGPRTGSRTPNVSIPLPLPPAVPGLDCQVDFVESLPPASRIPLEGGGSFIRWAESISGAASAIIRTESGHPALAGSQSLAYLAGWPDHGGWDRIIHWACESQGLEAHSLPQGLRMRDTAQYQFVFNYSPETTEWNGLRIPPAGVMRHPHRQKADGT